MSPVKSRWKSVCYQQFLSAYLESLKHHPVLNKPITEFLEAPLESHKVQSYRINPQSAASAYPIFTGNKFCSLLFAQYY